MLLMHFRLALVAFLLAAFGACDGTSLAGPEEQEAEAPTLRTACMAGGDVAQRAGCPEDTWSNAGDPFDPWEEDLSPREKWPN
ncbi:MAG: hypothetical protein KJO06_01280 [Gemmatimonadetes bacterium]|nr:hypothetical protein [Gemmatimonadota bacterium]NNK49212.1 hypothetical protein [Gemmatimonadota bacterium]